METTAIFETRKCTSLETRQNAAYNMPVSILSWVVWPTGFLQTGSDTFG